MKAAALRLVLKITNRAWYLAAAMIALVTGTGMLYDHFEKKNFFDSLWWAVVTASTVGYGDFYPKTNIGRVIGMVLIAGMVLFILPLITAQFASKLIVDSNAFTHDEQEELKHNVQVIAELLTHMQAKTCLCIWDDHQQPIQINPLCSVHAKENDGRDGDRDLLHGKRVRPGPDEEAERRGAAFRRAVSVAGRGDNPSDGRGPGQSGGP